MIAIFRALGSSVFNGVILSVAVIIGIVGFVPGVPGQNARVILECTNNALYVGFQPGVLRYIREGIGPRTLHPAGIVVARCGFVLLAELWALGPSRSRTTQAWAGFCVWRTCVRN